MTTSCLNATSTDTNDIPAQPRTGSCHRQDALNSGRIPVIDAFRGLCVLSVIAFHYLVRFAPPFAPYNLYGYSGNYPSWLEILQLGVEVFFVISGTVIALTLVKCGDPVEFAVRRFARLYPAFIVAATLTFALMVSFAPEVFQVGPADYLANFTMLAPDLHHKWVDGVYWSLAIEVKFYAMAAVSYFIWRDRFWIALIFISAAGLMAQYVQPYLAHKFLIPQYMPEFLMGIGTYYFAIARRKRQGLILMAVAFALYCANERFMSPLRFTPHIFGDAYILLLSAAMVALIVLAPQWRMGPLAFVGKISYSLYLLHNNIGVFVISALKSHGVPDLVAAGLALLACGSLAWLSFSLVERPGRRAVMQLYSAFRARHQLLPISSPAVKLPRVP